MPIKRVTFTSIWFRDVAGVRREIKGLSLPKRRRFLDLLALLSEIALENADSPIATLYDQNPDFNLACDECLSLFELSPDWISASMLIQLLFSCEGREGLLHQLEFPPTEQTEEGKGDPYLTAIATVWSHMPGKSLNEVRETIEAWTWVELAGILEARNDQFLEANPELKKEAEKKQRKQELLEEFKRDLQEGKVDAPLPTRGRLASVMGVPNG